MELFSLVYGGVAALFFFLGGLAFMLADLSGIFCYYQGGDIYLLRWRTPVAKDTPENRRRVSRCMGGAVLAVDFLFTMRLLGIAMQVI